MIACGFVMCAVTADMKPTTALFGTAAAKWLIATFIVGLGTNFFALGAISWKFWVNSAEKKKAANVKAAGTISLRTVLVILVESTAIYSGTKFINLMLLIAGTNVAYVFFCLVIPVIGIASHLLIIHVGYEKYSRHFSSDDYPIGLSSPNTRTNTMQMQIRIPSRPESPNLASPTKPLFGDTNTSAGMSLATEAPMKGFTIKPRSPNAPESVIVPEIKLTPSEGDKW
ncbi:hypothetical protein VKT23_002968 [Stygiomarasmius scandens]|uniref:Uncharacterized protein n=1 Tax=Marasmiellus scandens TaxID=2682957 RepID=A0ABR1JZZ2_9AGAR